MSRQPLFCKACGKLYGSESVLAVHACSSDCMRELYWRESLSVLELPYKVRDLDAAHAAWLEGEDNDA